MQAVVVPLSASRINLYHQCPAKYYYSRILKPKTVEVDDSDMRLGLNFHDQIIPDYFSRIPSRPTESSVEVFASESFANLFDDSLSPLKVRAEGLLRNFIRFEQGRLEKGGRYSPELVEGELVSRDGLLKGRVDFYGGRVCLDWKTGENGLLTVDLLRQSGVYRVLLEDNGYPTDKVLFVILDSGRVLEAPKTTRGWVLKEREYVHHLIERGLFPVKPSPLCEYCPYVLRCQMRERWLWW